MAKAMSHINQFTKTIDRIDAFQQRHTFLAFCFAVIKKYNEDQIGYQAALLTYYAFLSLFPLLLVLTTVMQLIVVHNLKLQMTILHDATSYFPVLGNQLAAHIHSLHKNGVALLVGTIIIFYGARGVADVFRLSIGRVWQPLAINTDNFLDSSFKSLKIIIAGGGGFIAAAISAGFAATAGHGLVFRLLSICINAFILFWLFIYLFKLCMPSKTTFRELKVAAVVAASGLVILQILGGYLLIHVLKNLDALYSNFATTLGLIFWLYLQARVVYYSVEIATIQNNKLWPRSLNGSHPTKADSHILGTYR